MDTCVDRNTHDRKEEEIMNLHSGWESTPEHMNTLDLSSTLQDASIQNVEMQDEDNSKGAAEVGHEDKVEDDEGGDGDEDSEETSFLKTSKWEIMDREEKLARLDGTTSKVKKSLHRTQHTSIEDWLEIGDAYNPARTDGKKRVRWADLEMRKEQAKVKEMGFVLGKKMYSSNKEAEADASRLLTNTKIIPNRFQSEFHNQS